MNVPKKIICSSVALLLLFPLPGNAAGKARVGTTDVSRQGNKPVITIGDRPNTTVMRNRQAVALNSEKAGMKYADARKVSGRPAVRKTAPKRNLNAIYILPKGYKDITIKGKAEATKKQAAQLIAANNRQMPVGCSVGEIVDLYWEEAEREGIRPDMALSQALLETGYFNFGGSVEPWQHNFCGPGTIGNGVKGAAFKTAQEGVRAHIQHLLAYCSHDRPKTKLIDPRYDKAHNLRLQKGLITKWSGLNWTWAMGGEYAEKIVNTHQLMLRCADKEPEGMWKDYKKQQKELEKIYERKLKEREEANKKYRKNETQNRQKPRVKETARNEAVKQQPPIKK